MKKGIRIDEVLHRTSKVKPALSLYPLYLNYREHYDFQNILECANTWLSYTGDEYKAFKKMLELFDITCKNGSENNVNIIAGRMDTICESVDQPALIRQLVTNEIKQSTGIKHDKLLEMYGTLSNAIQCDRVLKNHDMISKRFNIDSFIREHTYYKEDIDDVIYELCSFIDTYKLGLDSKYSIALEEAKFIFSKHHIDIPERQIFEDVTDYFLVNHLNKDDSKRAILHIMETVTEKNRFIGEESSYLTELADSMNDVVEESVESLLENSMKDKCKLLVDKFKLLPDKSEAALRNLITNLLVVNKENNTIDGTKNALSIVFYFTVVVGSFSVGVIPGLFAIMATKTINMVAERSYYTKTLQVWYKHRDSVARKMSNCKDQEKKKKMEEYLKDIDKTISKLEDHSDSLRGDDEKKSWDTRPKNYSGKSDDDDFDFDIKFDEEAKIYAEDIGIIAECMGNITWDKDKVQNTLFASDIITEMQTKDIDYLTEFCVKYPGMIDEDRFIEALEYANKLASKNLVFENYDRVNCYNENITKLKDSKAKDPIEKVTKKELTSDDVFSDINGMYEYTKNINSYVSCINELSLTSNLTLAMNKLSNTVSDLSDKEKIVSRSIDAACRILQHNVERAFTMENREAVIRGDILPPASKVIKLAAVSGIAAFVHPALAVIILLGRFAMNAKIRTKERQLVLDELDVELKMIDKYIADADEKKDYKKEKELLLIKKKLEAQHSRLKYKCKFEWAEDNVKTDDNKKED